MQTFTKAGILALAFAALVSVASAAPVVTQCGAPIKSIVKTDIEFFNTTSEAPVTIPSASVTISVPAGATRCVRVRFSAIANCPNACFLRAFENVNQLNPAWVSNALRFSSDQTNNGMAHSFEWAGRVGAGLHTIRIKIETGNICCVASIGPMTTSVDIME